MPSWPDPSLLPAYAAALAFGYLCGSIPFGLILTRLAGTTDIRAIGSGNIGATNVLRTGRKGLAAATLIADALKGTLAVLIVYYYYGSEYRYFAHELALPAAAGAFLGHLFPVWLGFKGGILGHVTFQTSDGVDRDAVHIERCSLSRNCPVHTASVRAMLPRVGWS